MELVRLLSEMISRKATDLHLIAGNRPSMVINGQMIFYDAFLSHGDMESYLEELIKDPGQKERLFQKKELVFAYELKEGGRFRVNAYFQRNSIAFSIRLIPLIIPDLEHLGLPPDILNFAELSSGLVLIIGPARSGKSTTAAAIVSSLNEKRSTHIITIEKPIEYIYRPNLCVISQREVNEDTPSFLDALKHVLQYTPGVLVVDGMTNEINEKQCIKSILEASEAGHLVLCTLRAWNIVQTINKLIDPFSEGEKKHVRVQIAQDLKGIISQRLLRRSDGQGFVCACEALKITNQIRSLIKEDRLNEIPRAIEDMRKEGMRTMNDCFITFFKQGIVSIDEIGKYAPIKDGYLDTFALM